MLAPVHVAAYDANAARPDASVARFTLPDLEMDGVMDPFGDNLMPRRAMEHPREWDDFADAASLFWGARCLFGGGFMGCAGAYQPVVEPPRRTESGDAPA